MADKEQTVIVGLSGGVDSAVAAALLLDQGYTVIGVSLSMWSAEGETIATSGSFSAAQKVAGHLGIPWVLIDRQKIFNEVIIRYYLDSLRWGNTPNPCIVCNPVIKWHSLLEAAEGLEANFMATGHYARRQISSSVQLCKARDIGKDQTYFLSRLGQAELKKTLFPLGDFMKSEVRQIARDKGIPVAERKESQDLCFLGELTQKDFISHYAPDMQKAGEIVDLDGRILGKHTGLSDYTEGQRKGIRIAHSEPLYVIRKDIQTNRLIVGEEKHLGRSVCSAGDVNWISGQVPGESFNAKVKIRYRAAEQQAEIKPRDDGKIDVAFIHSVRDITPGQALVMYQDDICLGMGFIE